MTMLCIICIVALLLGMQSVPSVNSRLISGSDVACRQQPDRVAPIVAKLSLGDLVVVREESSSEAANWYLLERRTAASRDAAQSPCWVHGSLTVEFSEADPQAALLEIARRLLASEATPFENYLQFEKLLGRPGFRPATATSAQIQLRRLQIIDRAGRILKDQYPEGVSKRNWLIEHRDLLNYFEPDAAWHVRPDAFWDLFERYKNTTDAEEIAWTAAQVVIPSDECMESCVLEKLQRTYSRYWKEFPKGTHLSKALAVALDYARYAASVACQDEPAESRRRAEIVRSSLTPIVNPVKRELVAYLNEVIRKCSTVERSFMD
jgi:hypothetical protein